VKHCLRNFSTALLLVLFVVTPVWAGKGVVLNFSDVDISTMVKFISDLTGKNFILDDRVKGKISVYSPAKLTTDEAFNVFTSVLELKGFTIVPSGKVLKIVPLASAKQSGTRVFSGTDRAPINDAYIARVISLNNISAQDAVSFLQPVVSRDGQITPFGPSNLLLVVDSANNIEKVLDILAYIDTPQRRDGAELVFLKNAPADNVANLVRDWLGGRDKGPKAAGTQASGGGIVIPDTRLNALVIFGSDKDKEDIKRLVTLVDVVPPSTSGKINVYFLEYADATEMVKVLDGFIKGSVAPVAGQQPGAPPGQQSPFESSKINVIADKPTNSLIIAASPNDYQSLLQVIQKLDKRRRQVVIQSTIAEISLDKLDEMGVKLTVAAGGASQDVGAAGVFDPFSILAGSSPQAVAVIAAIKALGRNVNVFGSINALAQNGLLSILSTPNILTADNKEAEIFVGENIPLVGNIQNVGGSGITQQSVNRQDTGIILKITPQITEGEYVKLDIYQEISAVKQNKGQAVDLVTTKRSAKTSVVAKNNETIAIGGLIQGREEENYSKVPFLGDIPGLGWLFKYRSITKTRTNLLILLTPQIMKDAATMNETTEHRKERFIEFWEGEKPLDIPSELNRKP
jgi:general secretion pathway protein D